uniref:Uncharacterized protein n=1 Tax=Porphyridium purpureum TaxID=35688 RepID=W0RZ12_PORPP|nr:hypothetical protein Y721_p193 [Porphyridium purpureum]BAO23615.1 hypothetical protein [Porphyridium purpureum]
MILIFILKNYSIFYCLDHFNVLRRYILNYIKYKKFNILYSVIFLA